MVYRSRPWRLAAVLVVLAGCGDGGDDPSPGEPEPPADEGTPTDPGAPGGAQPPPGGGSDGGAPAPGDGTGAGDPAGPPPGAGSPGGGGDTGGGGTPGAPSSAAPGSTVFARTFGGAGVERAVGPLAFGSDGGFVALSLFGEGDGAPFYLDLGLARFDAAGGLQWSRSYATHGQEVRNVAAAISPVGNVFLAFTSSGLDLGGGRLPPGGAVVKLAPDGRFVWQRSFPSVSGLAVDGSGSVLVGGDHGVVKLRWDGVRLWARPAPADAEPGPAPVAFDPAGNAIVAAGRHLSKLDADGRTLWSIALDGPSVQITFLGTTARGTVVAAGSFDGHLRYAGTELLPTTDFNRGDFVVATEADGRPRWARIRGRGAGPVAIDPAGRLALLEGFPSFACSDVLMSWDLTGRELWRRPVATCEQSFGEGAFARGVGVAPSGSIWVQGDANAPFDLGTGTLVPRASDWFLLRVAP